MDDKELLEITKEFFAEQGGDPASLKKAEQYGDSVEAVDIYQRNQDRIYDVSQKTYPKGSSAIVNMAVTSVIDGYGAEGLAKAYKRAQDDVDALKDQGERGRADLRRQQYMQEYFLPAVEIVVNSTSPDEVLNSKKALEELDKYVLLEGSGKGYTATYIRQAYGNQLGQKEGRSDASVQSGVRRLNALLDNGEIRTAFGLANKLKDQIDKGQAMADDIDYELIGRIVAYYK
jgi:hypothetical protein